MCICVFLPVCIAQATMGARETQLDMKRALFLHFLRLSTAQSDYAVSAGVVGRRQLHKASAMNGANKQTGAR